MSAFVTTHLIHSLIGQYQLFADISILPSLTSTPNYIWMFIRFILFYAVFYLGFPSVSYGLKHVFKKRQHVFNYWLTQYERYERFSHCLTCRCNSHDIHQSSMVIRWNLDCILRAYPTLHCDIYVFDV